LEHYKTDLKKRFPAGFASYESFTRHEESFLKSCLQFFESNKIIISCYQVFGSPKYSGTWTAKIVIDNPGAVLALGRKRNSLAYPHNSSYIAAKRKALFKGFEIVNNLKLGTTMVEKRRAGRKK
jgi:hypothetical protein